MRENKSRTQNEMHLLIEILSNQSKQNKKNVSTNLAKRCEEKQEAAPKRAQL